MQTGAAAHRRIEFHSYVVYGGTVHRATQIRHHATGDTVYCRVYTNDAHTTTHAWIPKKNIYLDRYNPDDWGDSCDSSESESEGSSYRPPGV